MPLDLSLLAEAAGVVLLVSGCGALEQSITTILGWDWHLAAAKAWAHRLGGRKRRGFAAVEAGIDLVVNDGLRDAQRG